MLQRVHKLFAHSSSLGESRNASHLTQLAGFCSHASKVSSVGGSKPHLDVEELPTVAAATGAAAGTTGFLLMADFSLTKPNRPA